MGSQYLTSWPAFCARTEISTPVPSPSTSITRTFIQQTLRQLILLLHPHQFIIKSFHVVLVVEPAEFSTIRRVLGLLIRGLLGGVVSLVHLINRSVGLGLGDVFWGRGESSHRSSSFPISTYVSFNRRQGYRL